MNQQEYYRWSSEDNMFNSVSLKPKQGQYSISFISWRTAFSSDNDNSESIIFQRFRNYRNEIARRIGISKSKLFWNN